MNKHKNVSLEHLMRLPLLQGMSRTDILRMAGMVPFNFSKVNARHIIARAGERCRGLTFIVSGSIEVETKSDDGTYALREWFAAPFLLQPESLFGLRTCHTATVRAAAEAQTPVVSLLQIEKSDVRDLLLALPTFRLNYMNILCRSTQQLTSEVWGNLPEQLPERIVRFLRLRCTYPTGRKELRIDMKRLATELGATRLNTSRALHKLASTGALRQRRACVEVPDFRKLEECTAAMRREA